MDSNTQNEASMPKLCENGCGFFANPDLNSLCSKCNREKQSSEVAVKAVTSAAPAAAPSTAPAQAPQLPAATPAAPPVVAPSPAAPASQPAVEPAPAVSPAAPTPQQQLSPQMLKAVAAAATAAAGDSATQQAAAAAAEQAAEDDEPPRRVQKNTNRCFSCNKKVGLTGFKCRCGYVFCGPHRLAEAHQCDFDYKSTGRESLAKSNPLVQADRVTRF